MRVGAAALNQYLYDWAMENGEWCGYTVGSISYYVLNFLLNTFFSVRSTVNVPDGTFKLTSLTNSALNM